MRFNRETRCYRAGLIAWLLAVSPVLSQVPGALDANHTEAEVIFSHVQARPGDTLEVGIRLTMEPGWHTYWEHPGDAGGATEISWKMPSGWSVGALRWPLPQVYDTAGIRTYVYHDEVLLMAPLQIAADAEMGVMEVQAEVSWLECAEICLPAETQVTGELEIGAELVPSPHAELFDRYGNQVPGSGEPTGLRAHWQATGDPETRQLIVSWDEVAEEADFYGYPGSGFHLAVGAERVGSDTEGYRLQIEASKWEGSWPDAIEGVLILAREPVGRAYAVELRPGDVEQEPASDESGETTLQDADEGVVSGSSSDRSMAVILVFAFVGGLILNFMPCVLPVIALKVLSFVRQAESAPGIVRRHGLLYGVGVLASFALLAGVVIAVQAGNRLASWGMQFQSPGFLLVMTILVVLVALNLFGVFEVSLGGKAMGAAAGLASREGDVGAFFNGVLATTLATPCTAPFLGTAVGVAFTKPPLIIVAMFLVIGAGLAAPYVVISFMPSLGRWLPRPGPWMERFKVAMGFPMLGAGVWLLSLLTRHYGVAGVLWVGIFLVVLGAAAWVWGQFGQRTVGSRRTAMIVSVVLVVIGYWVILERQLGWREDRQAAEAGSETVRRGGLTWQYWSAEALRAAQATGAPVLVDFTADWCATCQVNKKTSIEIDSVRQRIDETGAVLLLGDYTLRDDAITEELRRHGRAGVPLVLVYRSEPGSEPKVLPEVLTPSMVLEALEWAMRGG